MILTTETWVEKLSDGTDIHVASVTEIGITTQGKTLEDALANSNEALAAFFDNASQEEIDQIGRSTVPCPDK
jgi:predicted RNase H-like HicB family nuclease